MVAGQKTRLPIRLKQKVINDLCLLALFVDWGAGITYLMTQKTKKRIDTLIHTLAHVLLHNSLVPLEQPPRHVIGPKFFYFEH